MLTLILQIYLMASLKALVTSVAVNEIRDVYDRYQIIMHPDCICPLWGRKASARRGLLSVVLWTKVRQ